MEMILASASPRRKALLEQMGIKDFRVVPAEGGERIDHTLPFEEMAKKLALGKAEWVARREGSEPLIIGADTIVVLDGQVMGKPRNQASAFQMLSSLSGRRHTVYTGLAVLRGEEQMLACEATGVRFCNLTEREILDYIATGEPMDKAGAYGIQGLGALLVDNIQGDFYNVVGLPICRLGRMLAGFGVYCLGH